MSCRLSSLIWVHRPALLTECQDQLIAVTHDDQSPPAASAELLLQLFE